MKNLRVKTLLALKWSVVGQIIRQSLQFAIIVILARILSPREFGLMAMIITFSGFARLFSELNLGAALVQKQDLEEYHLISVFWINIVLGIFLSLIVFAAAPLVALFYKEPILKTCTMVISLNFFLGSLSVVQHALLQKRMDFRRIAIIETTAVLISGIIAIIMALMGFGVWSLIVQSLLHTAFSGMALWYFSKWRPSFSFNTKGLKGLMGFGSNLLGSNIVNYWVRNVDSVLIGRFIGTWALGIYARAYSLMLLPTTQISGVFSRVMFSSLSLIQKDIERVKRIYLQANRNIALVTFPLMIGLLVVARPFILVVFGTKWQEVIPILRIFCLLGMGQSIVTTVGWIYNSQGRTDIQFRWGIITGIVYFLSFMIGLRWGIIGVAIAYGLSFYVLLWYPTWVISGRLINLRFMEMLKNLSGPFCCAITMGVAVWIIRILLSPNWPDWLHLVVSVLFGMAIYVALIYAFRLKAYQEVRSAILEQIRS